MRPGRPLLTAVPLAVLLAGCGSAGTGSSTTSAGEYADNGSAPGSTTAPPAGPSGGAVTYRVADYTFPALTVAPGTRVQVVDGDDEPHTVTAEDGTFDTGSFDPAHPGAFTAPSRPGSYRITCKVHPSMHGEIVVR